VGGKHSKRTKNQTFDTSYATSQTPQALPDFAAADESGEFDSIIADLLQSAVEAENASTIAKPRFDFETELDAVIDNAFKNAAEASEANTKVTDEDTAELDAADKNTAGADQPVVAEGNVGQADMQAVAPASSAKAILEDDEFETYDETGGPDTSGSFIVEPISRRAVWPLFICAIVVFIVVTGGLTYFNRWLMAGQAEERAVIQQRGNDYLNESIALIQEADSVIVALDKASESRVTEEDIPRLEALLDQVDSVQHTIDLGPDPDATVLQWGVGLEYQYNENVIFGLSYIDANWNDDAETFHGYEDESRVQFRTLVVF
jgi:hypothetical protein